MHMRRKSLVAAFFGLTLVAGGCQPLQADVVAPCSSRQTAVINELIASAEALLTAQTDTDLHGPALRLLHKALEERTRCSDYMPFFEIKFYGMTNTERRIIALIVEHFPSDFDVRPLSAVEEVILNEATGMVNGIMARWQREEEGDGSWMAAFASMDRPLELMAELETTTEHGATLILNDEWRETRTTISTVWRRRWPDEGQEE